MTTQLITGNTYPVREELRALGGRWDAAAKGWRVPIAVAERARLLVAATQASAPRARRTRQSCGYPGCRADIGLCDECC